MTQKKEKVGFRVCAIFRKQTLLRGAGQGVSRDIAKEGKK